VISVYGFAVDLITQVTTRMSGSTEKHTAYIYRANHDTRIKERPRRQLQLDRSFLLTKGGKQIKDKQHETKKKAVSILTELQAREYNSWVANTGVIGAPGHRPQRNVARKRA